MLRGVWCVVAGGVCARVPIFGLTGNDSAADVETFTSAGANRVLGKPLEIEKFEEAYKQFKLPT